MTDLKNDVEDSINEEFFIVTPEAIQEFKRIALSEKKQPRFRLACKGGGCAGITVCMNFTELPADKLFDLVIKNDEVEFLIDVKSAYYIKDAMLDYAGDPFNKGFKWFFPKSTGGCGCGTSFAF